MTFRWLISHFVRINIHSNSSFFKMKCKFVWTRVVTRRWPAFVEFMLHYRINNNSNIEQDNEILWNIPKTFLKLRAKQGKTFTSWQRLEQLEKTIFGLSIPLGREFNILTHLWKKIWTSNIMLHAFNTLFLFT